MVNKIGYEKPIEIFIGNEFTGLYIGHCESISFKESENEHQKPKVFIKGFKGEDIKDILCDVDFSAEIKFLKEEKPPLGLMPRRILYLQRQKEIILAMNRYNEAGKNIPEEWIDELHDINYLLVDNQTIENNGA